MRKRPRLKIELTPADRIVEAVGRAMLFAAWAFTLASYNKLPDIIPTHYNAAGEVDGYGAKATIPLLPFIATILFVGLTIVNRYPRVFNYLIKITEENALRQYAAATRMLRYLKSMLVLLFGYITFKTISMATQESDELNGRVLSLSLGVILIMLAFYIIRSVKTR
ncbi:MAG: DUF1648 domain-containing protein [Prevotellaceae bacterium]|jgi:uncharacterized membrane protein|nr:DUF1648 domain-containing protein [Prevotellaceae bacterium]